MNQLSINNTKAVGRPAVAAFISLLKSLPAGTFLKWKDMTNQSCLHRHAYHASLKWYRRRDARHAHHTFNQSKNIWCIFDTVFQHRASRAPSYFNSKSSMVAFVPLALTCIQQYNFFMEPVRHAHQILVTPTKSGRIVINGETPVPFVWPLSVKKNFNDMRLKTGHQSAPPPLETLCKAVIFLRNTNELHTFIAMLHLHTSNAN